MSISTSESISTTTGSISPNSTGRMKRRRAGVSRNITCDQKGSEIEEGKSLKRRATRRYAITKYSPIPLNYMKYLRKKVKRDDDQEELEKVPVKLPADHGEKLVVFNLQDVLDTEKQGSKEFLNIIDIYYREEYQFADSDTQRSILQSIVLDEMKVNGYKFVKKDLLHPEYFSILDDFHSIRLINDQFSIQKMKNIHYAHSA